MRLGVDEVGVTELMAVKEHAQTLSMLAGALLLDSLASRQALVPLLDAEGAEPAVRDLLEEIAEAMAAATGQRAAPGLWRAIAGNPHHLESTWRKEQVVMRTGRLDAHDKRRIALGVAMNARSRYMIEYCAALLRQAGDSPQDLLEVLGVVDHYTSLNTLSDGMQLPSDIKPPA